MKKVKITALLLTALLLLLPGAQTQAAEKQMQVELDKDYSSCIFKIEFEEAGEYQAELVDANGNAHEYVRIDDTLMTCTLDKVKKGTYVTDIENENLAKVGKVTLSVTSAAEREANIVDKNIIIGKDISGLKMYFKDDTFIAKWTDETCGAVNVKVINLDTSETIKNEKVTVKEFSCALPKDVNTICVSIVPASSANITGAELTYTFQVDNYPKAEVIFPDYEKTNLQELAVKIVLEDTYSVYVENNEECVLTTDLMIAGSYDIQVPLKEDGENDIRFYIVDSDGNMRSTQAMVLKDTVAPSLSLTEEYDGMETSEENIEISGYVSNYDTFQVNDEAVETATDGYFSVNCKLHIGENKIKVFASDEAGNETEYNIVMNAVEPQKTIDWKLILAVMTIIIAGGSSLVKKWKQKRADKISPEEVFKEPWSTVAGYEEETEENDLEEEENEEDNLFDVGDTDTDVDKNTVRKVDKFSLMKRMLSKGVKRKKQAIPDSAGTEIRDDLNEETEDDSIDQRYDQPVEKEEKHTLKASFAESVIDKVKRWKKSEIQMDDFSVIEQETQADNEKSDPYTEQPEIIERTVVAEDSRTANVVSQVMKAADETNVSQSEDSVLEEGTERQVDTIGILAAREEAVPEDSTVNQAVTTEMEPKIPTMQAEREQPTVEPPDDLGHMVMDKNETTADTVPIVLQKSDRADTGLSDENRNPLQAEGQQTIIQIITSPDTKKKRRGNGIGGKLLHAAFTILFIVVLFKCIILHGFISSPSMEPALMVGDCTVSNRLAYLRAMPERGDIIQFEKGNEILGKRVIGVAGDTISFADGKVFVNDQQLDESEYLKEEVQTYSDKTFTVPDDMVFVLGDNREDSNDSRFWEEPYVAVSDIRAKLMFVIPTHFFL